MHEFVEDEQEVYAYVHKCRQTSLHVGDVYAHVVTREVDLLISVGQKSGRTDGLRLTRLRWTNPNDGEATACIQGKPPLGDVPRQ